MILSIFVHINELICIFISLKVIVLLIVKKHPECNQSTFNIIFVHIN